MGCVVLGLFLRRLRGGHRVPVAYFQFLENSGQAEPSQDNTAEPAPDERNQRTKPRAQVYSDLILTAV